MKHPGHRIRCYGGVPTLVFTDCFRSTDPVTRSVGMYYGCGDFECNDIIDGKISIAREC